MQYMALIYAAPGSEPAPGEPGWPEFIAEYRATTEQMKADGVFLSGEPLLGAETATSVRVRAGRIETMDGPFAETKEHLGGVYILDCPDLDSAIRYAATIPSARTGTIEIRPIIMREMMPELVAQAQAKAAISGAE